MLGLYKITGASMAPNYRDGDYVITCARRGYNPGDVVALKHPHLGLLIKRIAAYTDANHLLLQGDNTEHSTSTTAMGAVKTSDILGKVCWRIRKPVH